MFTKKLLTIVVLFGVDTSSSSADFLIPATYADCALIFVSSSPLILFVGPRKSTSYLTLL